MSYKVRYMESYMVLERGRWIDKKREKWVTFYPIADLLEDEYGDGTDKRPSEEVMKQKEIYGKAATGVAGYLTVWTYGTWKRKNVKVV